MIKTEHDETTASYYFVSDKGYLEGDPDASPFLILPVIQSWDYRMKCIAEYIAEATGRKVRVTIARLRTEIERAEYPEVKESPPVKETTKAA